MIDEYLLERKLKNEAPLLHEKVKNTVVVLEWTLQSFLKLFPDFTDHSILHSMDVLEFCNQLIGAEQVGKMNASECFVLIMGCYLHDVGMGVGMKDFEEFAVQLGLGEYLHKYDREEKIWMLRDYHHEFSGLFIRKYAGLFEIEPEELLRAVIQVSRGHRRVDLYDEEEYADIKVGDDVIRTAYLSAVIRLADEIDVASSRNTELLYDLQHLSDPKARNIFGTHACIRSVEVQEDKIILHLEPAAKDFMPFLREWTEKIQNTIDLCRDVAFRRSDLVIPQNRVVLMQEGTIIE